MKKNTSREEPFRIVCLTGDGIGPEICAAALPVLSAAAQSCGRELEISHEWVGGAAYERCGEMLPQKTLDACHAADAVLLGAVGGPRWDKLPGNKRPETALLGLRSALGLYANLRPARLFPVLAPTSPLRPERLEGGMDLLIVRELTGGLYFGKRGREGSGEEERAFDTERYSVREVRRVADIAFQLARKRRKHLTSVDKANVLESSRLWRETVRETAKRYPEVQLEELYVDNAAMQLVRRPASFDVMLASNLFGDILSDEAAELTGSIGLLPSASLGSGEGPGLFEPIHGSAPDIAGQDRADPLAAILSTALLCRYALRDENTAQLIEEAVERTLEEGWRCADLGGGQGENVLGCRAMGEKVLANLKAI